MKKILVAFDGHHFSEGALAFVKFVNDKNPVLLTGAFLPQVDYASLWSYSGGGQVASMYIPLVEDEDAEAVQQNIERFKEYCVKNKIEHRVHKDFFDFALPELKRESRFADMLVIGSESFYNGFGRETLNDYLKSALHDVECSVIVVPEKFEMPQTNIISYDGSASSVYAIRQFACLFPELAGNPTILVFADTHVDKKFPDEANIMELAARHFSDLSLLRFEENTKKQFIKWMGEKKGALLITGAFGRSGLSQLFKKSFVTDIIADHKFPVFIAHH
jgi:nucleotide-binding universal stress UspA family protein